MIAQSAAEVGEIQNSPSVSMGPYLIASEQTRLLTTLSIYSLRGDTPRNSKDALHERNGAAHMEGHGQAAYPSSGRSIAHRMTALLSFGVPFSE